LQSQHRDLHAELQEQLETARNESRKSRHDLDELHERAGRAEGRVAELQAVVDSLGRERTALRADAGSLRARAELLAAAEERARRLTVELEELRGENEFLNQELARVNAPGKAS
jgi:chromosome segregation ATPase